MNNDTFLALALHSNISGPDVLDLSKSFMYDYETFPASFNIAEFPFIPRIEAHARLLRMPRRSMLDQELVNRTRGLLIL
jgi:hypothetical protein